MAWRYAEEHVQDGDVVTPHEINSNVSAIVQEVNGRLDRDNLMAASIDTAKLKVGATNAIEFAELTAERNLILTRDADAIGADWVDIDDDLKLTILCVDGMLEVAANINYENGSDYALLGVSSIAIGLMVDDQLVAAHDGQNFETTLAAAPETSHQHVAADVPVGAGMHVVRPVIRMLESVAKKASIEIDFGCCYARNVRR